MNSRSVPEFLASQLQSTVRRASSLLDEVDFVNVRLDSRNLDCQPLNPWTSMAGRDAPGENFLPSPSINSLAQPYSGLSCRNSATSNSEKPFRESFASSCEG